MGHVFHQQCPFGKIRLGPVTGMPSIINQPVADGLVSSPFDQPMNGKRTSMYFDESQWIFKRGA